MDINEARRWLAENPPQGDPTEIAVGESLAEKAARLELEGLQRAMAAPLPSAEELAAGRAADRAMAERIHRARPGVPLHHVFAVLESLRTVLRLDAARAEAAVPAVPKLGRRNSVTGKHLGEVVRVYREAFAEGMPPTKAVAEQMGASHSTAARWVGMARKRGLLGPVSPGKSGEEG
jgi:hypothetical protein